MSQWVFYLDESGDCEGYDIPLKNGQTPLFVLTAVALPISYWREYSSRYVSLKGKFFKNEISESIKPITQWEAKGNRLCSPRNSKSRRNKVFLDKVISLVDSFGGKVFSEIFIKNSQSPTPPNSLYTMGIQNLSHRFDCLLEETNSYGFILADARMKKLNQKVTHSYLSYLFGNEQGRLISRLMEPTLFGDSKITVGLQITDNISSLVYGYFYNKLCSRIDGAFDYKHIEKRHWGNLENILYVSERPVVRPPFNGRMVHGCRLINFGK